jgi:asparagine synthase (glutamine-hydrolysing)
VPADLAARPRADEAWIIEAPARDVWMPHDGTPALTVASVPGVTLALSGTVFDLATLAATLKVPASPSPNAAALVLQAYVKLGDGWIDALRGCFSVVIDDRRQQRVVAARDPMGLQPLFYVRAGDALAFSWSTEALVGHPRVSGELDRVILAEHLLHRWADPSETYIKAIKRLPAGHLLTAERDGVRLRRYWDPAHKRPFNWLREDELPLFEQSLDRAVERCLGRDSAGIYLSGGFDSISVAAVACDAATKLNLPMPRALSLGFPDPECNEEVVQRGVAQRLAIQQEFIKFEDALGGRGLLMPAAEMAATWPMPMMNIWNPAYRQLAARGYQKGCRVILTGNGGDEWLAVSPFLAADMMRRRQFVQATKFIGVLQRSYKMTWPQALYGGLWKFGARPLVTMAAARMFPDQFEARRRRNMNAGVPAWVAPDPEIRRAVDERAHRVLAESQPSTGSFYEREMRTALDHPLNSIEAEEYFEMGRRLGVRMAHPYWDADLVDVLYRVPPHLLLRGGRAKGLIRDTIARRFPDLGFERQRKIHATNFYWRTMQTEGPRAWATLGSATTLGSLGVVDAKLHGAAMAELFAGQRPQESYRIWNTLQLEAWARPRA